MADLSRARRRILSTIIALGVVDVAALVYLAIPLRAGAAQPANVEQRAKEEYRQLSRTTVPLRGIDQKLVQAQKEDAAFIANRLPSHSSNIYEELGKLANASHINITSIAYKASPTKLAGVENLEVHAGLAGSYVNLVKFMNAVERDKMFFIIDSIGLSGQRASEVRLDMKLDTYLRTQS